MNVNVTDITDDSLNGDMSEMSRSKTSPIYICGLHKKGKGDFAQTSCSLTYIACSNPVKKESLLVHN